MTMITLPYGGKNVSFDENDLIRYMKSTCRNYIIQGQQNCSLANHTKKSSLDYWLRINYAATPDTKQAVNKVIEQLMNTDKYEIENKLPCPDSGHLCKGIRLKG
jgi:hypothetical protein